MWNWKISSLSFSFHFGESLSICAVVAMSLPLSTQTASLLLAFIQPMYVFINNAAIIFFLFVYLILSFQKKTKSRCIKWLRNRSPIRHFNYASLFDMHHCICTHAVICALGWGFCTRTMMNAKHNRHFSNFFKLSQTTIGFSMSTIKNQCMCGAFYMRPTPSRYLLID